MREWKSLLPALLVLVVIGVSAAIAPLVAREVAFSVRKGKLEAVRSELREINSTHGHLGQLFRLTAESVSPAVVEIHVRRDKRPDQAPPRSPFSPRPPEWEEYGLGSGVVVDADKGLIVTNQHVIDQASEVDVVLYDGRRLRAQWLRQDEATDLALVKVKPARLIAAPWGDSDSVEVGDMVLAIGAPDGLAQSVTFGIISAKQRTAVGETASYADFFQTDAAINKGNSGGPLVNLKGQVIAINTAIRSRSGGNEGIGFAIPANMARQIYRQLARDGQIVRGFLGIRMQNLTEGLAESFQLPDTRGVLISELAPRGPAQQAGLAPGDCIVEIDQRSIRKVQDLRTVVAQMPPGTEAEVVFYRDGRKRTTTVTIGQQPEVLASAFGQTRQDARGPDAGMVVVSMNDELARQWGYEPGTRGALILQVLDGSPADRAGLSAGDLITSAQGRAIAEAGALREMLRPEAMRRGLRLLVTNPRGHQSFKHLGH
jgi:Do/DeqQ family serine protease